MKLNQLSDLSKYYFLSLITLLLAWGLLSFIDLEFLNLIFFLMAFVWHFALLAPGLKQKVLTSHHRLSFLSVVMRIDHYLHLFIGIRFNKIPFSSAFIRAFSPFFFCFLLFVFGGSGNLLFTLLGSLVFELMYFLVYLKMLRHQIALGSSPSDDRDDLEIPPAIPTEEINHE